MQLFKNVASQKMRVFAFADAGHATLDPGEPVTGDAANISAVTAVDNAALGASNDVNPDEVDATNAKGYYEFSLSQAESNGDSIEFYPQSSTAGVQVVCVGGNVQTILPPNLPALGIGSDGDLLEVNTLTDHTAQTGDSYAYLGTNLGAAGANATEAGGDGDHLSAIPDMATVTNQTAIAAYIDTEVAAIKAVTDNLPDSGALTSLAQADTMEGFFQVALRSDSAIATDRAAILTLINANEGTGAGDYAVTSDSQEAIRDWVGDGANLTEAGGTGDHLTAIPDMATSTNQATIAAYIDTEVAAIVAAIGTPIDLGSGATLGDNLSDIAGATFSAASDSLEAIRDRGDAAWTTGAGGSDRLLMVDTTIATLASQTSFTLTAGSADDDAYNGCTIVIEDVSTSTQKAVGIVDDYTGSTKTVTLLEDPGIFTMAATDKVYILAERALKPTTFQDYHVDVTAGGAVGINWANIENPTTAVDLSGTDIQLCDTVTTNTDMRGTDDALLASTDGSSFTSIPDMATATNQATIAGYIDNEIASILTILGTPAADLAADIAAIKSVVDSVLSDTGTDGVVLAAATMNAIADHVLRRSFATAAASGSGDTKSFRSLLGAIAKLVNKVAISGTTLSIYEADDTTALGTQTLTTSASADPITAADTD